MIRLSLLLILLPFSVAADWSPRPSMFDYGAAFDLCTLDAGEDDLAQTCTEILKDAYVLKRAVAQAAHACGATPLPECPIPFEETGLPAIASRIATDMGCDPTPIVTLPRDLPLSITHCVSMTADILFDEGVVPLNTEIDCQLDATECLDLATIHATLWTEKVDLVADADPTINDLQARNANDCLAQMTTGDVDGDLSALTCIANRAASLWGDLAQ